MRQFYSICITAFCGVMLSLPAFALEATAGSGTDQTSLQQAKLDSTEKLTILQANIDNITWCNKLGKFYKPGQPGADGNGCVAQILSFTSGKLCRGTGTQVVCDTTPPVMPVIPPIPDPEPAGTLCGLASLSCDGGIAGVKAYCRGHNPASSCPSTHSSVSLPIWGGRCGQSFATCVKR